jgi:hypothetical protein
MSSRVSEDFSAANAEQFAAELDEEIALADDEWRQIDSRLLKWFAGETATALVTASQIGFANVGWVAASWSLLGATDLAVAQLKRKSLRRKLPGAFFLGTMKKQR